MKSLTEHLWFEIAAGRAFINITPTVDDFVKRSGVAEGVCLVNAMRTTASVFINDDQSGLPRVRPLSTGAVEQKAAAAHPLQLGLPRQVSAPQLHQNSTSDKVSARVLLSRSKSTSLNYMKILPTFVHGIVDYIGGLALLAAPNIFGFADVGGAAVWIPRILGVVVLLQSICTRYELGLVKVLPMKMHLMNDYIASIFLAVSPWLFGFANGPSNQWMPHLVVGILVFVATLMTESEPRTGTAAR